MLGAAGLRMSRLHVADGHQNPLLRNCSAERKEIAGLEELDLFEKFTLFAFQYSEDLGRAFAVNVLKSRPDQPVL